MALVDTSFLLALQVTHDRFHQDALATPLYGDRFLIPWEIWTEYCHYVALHFDAPVAGKMARSILDGPFQVENALDSSAACDVLAHAGPVQAKVKALGFRPLTFFDLVVGSLAARFKESVLTFDEGIKAAIRARAFPGARLS